MNSQNKINLCIIVPVYNHPDTVATVISSLLPLAIKIILVDDGSSSPTKEIITYISAQHPSLTALRLDKNSGKGAAVIHGFRYAISIGFTHALVVDADSQHCVSDLHRFISSCQKHPDSLIIGQPEFGADAPWARVWGRKISNILVWIETLSLDIHDVLCGLRVYPLAGIKSLFAKHQIAKRMGFELDTAVRLHWQGVSIVNIKTKVSYPEDGISHFRYLEDNLLIAMLHLRLLFGMFVRAPWLITKKFTNQKSFPKHWLEVPERGSLFAFSLILTVFRLFGRRVCYLLLYPIVFYFYCLDPASRRASFKYLKHLYDFSRGAKTPASSTVFQHLLEFAIMILDKVSAWCGAIKPENVKWDNLELFKNLVAEKQGAILLGAHLGNLEVARAVFCNLPDVRINALMFRQTAKIWQTGLQKINPSNQVQVIPLEDIGPETIIRLSEKIKNGEYLGLLADRISKGSNERKIAVSFLGHPAFFPEGPWILSALLQCPIYFMFCFRISFGQYQVVFEKFEDKIVLPAKDKREAIECYMKAYVKRLEQLCLQYPFQWFNFYEFWD